MAGIYRQGPLSSPPHEPGHERSSNGRVHIGGKSLSGIGLCDGPANGNDIRRGALDVPGIAYIFYDCCPYAAWTPSESMKNVCKFGKKP
jgi:hypothetical protein